MTLHFLYLPTGQRCRLWKVRDGIAFGWVAKDSRWKIQAPINETNLKDTQ